MTILAATRKASQALALAVAARFFQAHAMVPIVRLQSISSDVRELAAVALAEGHGNVARLVADFDNGANRFDAPGEALFAAKVGETGGRCP